jgi:hypothetical protein
MVRKRKYVLFVILIFLMIIFVILYIYKMSGVKRDKSDSHGTYRVIRGCVSVDFKNDIDMEEANQSLTKVGLNNELLTDDDLFNLVVVRVLVRKDDDLDSLEQRLNQLEGIVRVVRKQSPVSNDSWEYDLGFNPETNLNGLKEIINYKIEALGAGVQSIDNADFSTQRRFDVKIGSEQHYIQLFRNDNNVEGVDVCKRYTHLIF